MFWGLTCPTRKTGGAEDDIDLLDAVSNTVASEFRGTTVTSMAALSACNPFLPSGPVQPYKLGKSSNFRGV